MIHKWKIIELVTVLFIVVLFSSNAYALLIDFTDGDMAGPNAQNWSDVNGENEYSKVVDGLTVKLFTDSPASKMSFNGSSSESPGPLSLGSIGQLEGDGDGIGINRIGDGDEINNGETLTISLSRPSIIKNIYILDLFDYEVVNYEFDSDIGSASAIGFPSWGFLSIDTASNGATSSILFSATSVTSGDDGDHDYAVAGMNVAPVPEPATMLLFGTGLLGLAGLRLRKKK